MILNKKTITILDWVLPFVFSIIVSIIVKHYSDLGIFDWMYWIITIPIQLWYTPYHNKFINYLKEKRTNYSYRKLRFREYVAQKKREF